MFVVLLQNGQSEKDDSTSGMRQLFYLNWTQINGKNAISWEEKFKLDVWYVENHSFLLDLKILMLTVVKVFRREGIGYNTQDTTPDFTGKQDNKNTSH